MNPEMKERARRFQLQLPVRYGWFGEGTQFDAVTVNVSRTGILFTTGDAAPSGGERLDCIMRLPFGASVRSIGRVARVAAAPDGTQVAVRIERYWIHPHAQDPKPPQSGVARHDQAGVAAGGTSPAAESETRQNGTGRKTLE